MYIDNDLTFSNPNITTAASGAGTQYMSASIDLSVVRDLAEGHTLKFVTTKTGAFTGSADATIEVQIFTADSATTAGSYSAPTNPTQLATTGAIPIAAADALGLKVQVVQPFPMPVTAGLTTPGSKHQRYMFIRYVVISATSDAFDTGNTGRLQTSIVLDAQDGVTFYADAISTLPNPTP